MHYSTTQNNLSVQRRSERNERLAQVAKRAQLLVIYNYIGDLYRKLCFIDHLSMDILLSYVCLSCDGFLFYSYQHLKEEKKLDKDLQEASAIESRDKKTKLVTM